MRTTWRKALIVVRAILLAASVSTPVFAQNGSVSSPSPVVPVTTAVVTRQDVPVVVRALGTVQPFQSVLVRARVDGTLDKVFFTEGQYVKPGDLLAQLDPRPYQAILDQAVAKKAADEATLVQARADLVRYVDLAGSQVASRQRLDQARAAVGQAEAAVRGDDASIDAAQLNLGFTRIVSPIEGRVGLRLTDPGNFIRVADNNTTGIVTITQIRPISLIFTLPQDTLPQVQVAMRRAKLPVLAYSSDDKTKLSEGELLTTDSSIDVTTGTIKLKAVFANPDDALWPGQFVNVRLQLDTRRNAPAVPTTSVQRGPEGLYVYVVKPDSTVARQSV
ncbi:MAG: efflux RND transporter periplasmic adaptor subunit, partial [Acetobacteraceae bacterium]|nr:efflux RND transporter periplasmic adaptor subunit [Acetobacteraceae bacterium]